MNQATQLLENQHANSAASQVGSAARVSVADAAGGVPAGAMIIVPVRNMVLFPGMIVPISIGRESSIAAAQYAVKTNRPVGILLQRNPEVGLPGPTAFSCQRLP